MPEAQAEAWDQTLEFDHLWHSFAAARLALAACLLTFEIVVFLLLMPQVGAPLLICLVYFAACAAVCALPLAGHLGLRWLSTLGVDLLVFTGLYLIQMAGISTSYTPLFVLPTLMAGMLGSMPLALGTAAVINLLLLLRDLDWFYWQLSYSGWSLFQTALTGLAFFAIAFISNRIGTRLANMERRARRSQIAAAEQRQINELVIKSLGEGVLVVNQQGQVHTINPAACLLLEIHNPANGLDLATIPGSQSLLQLIELSFASQTPQQANISLPRPARETLQLRVHTQLTEASPHSAMGFFCVVFMQDQREIQARIRAEKLAGMGRMSAAVAHEIRNPLAAISQANALLIEDLDDLTHQRLAQIIRQNALRLENTVKDVLHMTHTGAANQNMPAAPIDLCQYSRRICHDWCRQHDAGQRLTLDLPANAPAVSFNPEHLRRVLINLLDNAWRYASNQAASIQLSVSVSAAPCEVVLRLWSDGAALDAFMQQHLFEPFFSTESRSSGLGLYICRELCESHGASIGYQRNERLLAGQLCSGNEFNVSFKLATEATPGT